MDILAICERSKKKRNPHCFLITRNVRITAPRSKIPASPRPHRGIPLESSVVVVSGVALCIVVGVTLGVVVFGLSVIVSIVIVVVVVVAAVASSAGVSFDACRITQRSRLVTNC